MQAPGFDFLGDANAGITASFSAAGDAYLSAAGVRITRVADVAPLRGELRARGLDGSFRPGTAIVLATLAAERALVMTARSHNTRFAARVRVNVPIAPAVPADLAGNLSVTRGAGTVDLQEYSVGPVVLALRLLILVRRGWLWWRHLNVQGLGSVADDERLQLLEALADDDDFVVPLH